MSNFDELFANVCEALRREQRISYRALRRRFELSDDDLEDLKVEIIKAKQLAVDEEGEVLVWTNTAQTRLEPTSQPDQTTPPDSQDDQPTKAEPQPTNVPDAERRQLTVMFCDLVGSTELSGQMDAEDYRELVRAYQDACGDVIEHFDCHIAQTLGDGLLIYSGYPVAHENDAERAVRVGLGIIDAMKTLNERLEQDRGIRLAVRVGIHTGLVVVGDVGAGATQEQLALGEVPNVASRIQGLAEPDTVVISADTYRLIQGYFDCDALGEHDLRGVAQPIAVYQVLQESGAQSRLDIARARGLTPLVGREQEVGLLLERWAQCCDGNGQIVLLSGEPGIGKTRVVQTLKDHVADQTHIRLECRSSPYFTHSALYPIIDMVQRTLRFEADGTPEKKLAKLEQSLSQYRLALEETVPLFGALLSLSVPEDQYSPLNLSPQRQRQKTLEAIVTITLELAERQPVLFILDDAHWTDPTTLEFIDLLMPQTPTTSILILITYRPEFQPTWGNRSYLTQLTLNRLARDQIERMAEQVAGGKELPDEIVEQLMDRTDGVPLYVEEMTKSVLESGLLKESDEQYELTGPVSSLSIPSTLQDSLMSRLDRLVTAKAVAQYASVIGRQFSYELLQAVSDLDDATLQRELGRLVEAELVYQRGVVPNATYLFKHALVQNTAYESLLRSTRQGYHRRIAEALAARFPETVETQPELLAHHYTEAGLNEQAVGYWQQAGEKAVQRSAHQEAISHLSSGLALLKTLSDSPQRAQRELTLRMTLSPSLTAAKGFAAPEVEQNCNRAQELCQQVGPSPYLMQVLLGLRGFYLVRAELEAARELSEHMLRIAQDLQDPLSLLDAHRVLGHTLLHLGEFLTARTHLEQGKTVYISQLTQTVIPISNAGLEPVMFCLTWLANVLWLMGYPDQALECSNEALAIAQERAHAFSLAAATSMSITLHQWRGDLDTVQERHQTVMTMASEHGYAQSTAQGTIRNGLDLIKQGQIEEGRALVRQGLTAYRATGAVVRQPMYLAELADALLKAEQVEEGLTVLAEALEHVNQTSERWWEAELYRLKGELLLAQSIDNEAEAESNFHQAISIAQHQSAKSWELRAATSLARLWQSQGKRDEARELLRPVYDWFTEGFDTADLIDAKALLGELEESR